MRSSSSSALWSSQPFLHRAEFTTLPSVKRSRQRDRIMPSTPHDSSPPIFSLHAKPDDLLSAPNTRKTHTRYQNPIPLLYTHRHPLAVLIQGAGADGQDLGLVEVFLRGLGEEDAAGGLFGRLHALDEDAVHEGEDGFDGADGGGLGLLVMEARGGEGMVEHERRGGGVV